MATLPLRSLLLAVALSFAAGQPALAQLKPIVSTDVKHDVSPSMKDLPPGPERPNFEEETLVPIEPPTPNEPQSDPAVQRIQGKELPLSFNLGFDGLGDGVYGFSVSASPPDTTGAVGATQFVQWVNLSYAVFDKDTGDLLAGPIRGNRLWQDFGGGCELHNNGDPTVVYDKLADRWVLSQLVSSPPYLQCIAVSTSNDATDTFYRYAFAVTNLPDYGKLGVWPDAYYMGFNSPISACAFEREAMLEGLDARQVCFRPSQAFMLPSDLDGLTPPPDGSPNFFMRLASNNQGLILNKFHVDFENPSESTFTGPITIPVDTFTRIQSRIPQPNTTNRLDSLNLWLMFRLAYRNFGDHESLVLNHSVQGDSIDGNGGVRWYEIQDPNGDPFVYQQGSFIPDSNYRWMGSIAMDGVGNIAVGYSLSSSEVYPSLAINGRLPDDPLGTLGSEIVLVDGTGSQTGTNYRWGDYSTMSIDPVNDCTFWYTGEYHKTSGRPWSTWIASFQFDTCIGK